MKSKLVVFIITILVLSTSSTFGSFKLASTANAKSSCSSSNALQIIAYPLPSSLNWLTTSTLSGFYLSAIEDLSLTPLPVGLNGALDYGSAVADWVSHNANYTQWTFNVKPGLKWSDGTNVTSQDILNTFSPQYALNASFDFVGIHSEVSKEYALNSSAAVYVLNQSDAHLPEKMSTLIYTTVEPPAAIQQGPGANLFNVNVGDGPYIASNYTSGSSQLVMTRNPYYKPLPAACEILVNIVESNTQAAEFLTAGRADLAGPLDPSNIPSLLNVPNLHVSDDKGNLISTLEYNITSYPYNMTAFRQALAYAVDDQPIVQQALGGYAYPGNIAEGTVSPKVANLYNANASQYPYNQTKALQLLSSIGMTIGSDKNLHYPNGTAVTTTVWTSNEKTYDPVMGSLVAESLKGIGIQATIRVVSASDITADYASNSFGIRDSLVLWTSEGATFISPWLDAQPGWNVYLRPGYPNSHWEYPPNIDAQYQSNLTAMDNTADPASEAKLLSNIQQLNAQYLPVLVLAYPDNLWAYSTARFTGWPTNSYDAFENGGYYNVSVYAYVVPASGTTSATSTSISTTAAPVTTTSSGPLTTSSSISSSLLSSSTIPASTISTSAQSTTTIVTTASSTTTSSGNSLLTIGAIVVVIIIVIAAVAALMFRRRPAK